MLRLSNSERILMILLGVIDRFALSLIRTVVDHSRSAIVWLHKRLTVQQRSAINRLIEQIRRSRFDTLLCRLSFMGSY